MAYVNSQFEGVFATVSRYIGGSSDYDYPRGSSTFSPLSIKLDSMTGSGYGRKYRRQSTPDQGPTLGVLSLT